MTVNEGSAVVTRQQNASTTGFEVKVQEEEANDGAHASETIGYIAIEPTVGTTGEMAYEAQQTPDAVTYGWGGWSAWADFNFGDVGGSSPPPAPTGLSPDGGIAITTSSVTLSANPISVATQYEFDIWYWNGSTWQYYYTHSTTTNAQTFWPAVSNTAYQWRARAQNTYGWGGWSSWTNFNFQ